MDFRREGQAWQDHLAPKGNRPFAPPRRVDGFFTNIVRNLDKEELNKQQKLAKTILEKCKKLGCAGVLTYTQRHEIDIAKVD